ncbi:DUF6265 family protein [Sunxiuqinia sp. A32]|uniref:DUF6265 family protein n=1 Tax=Sunxiuqinia sp. A32 TaxID=3461496 RepID=UPI00404634EF
MRIVYLFLFAVLFTLGTSAFGQNIVNTMQLDSLKSSPNAQIDQVSWIQGHWRGNAFGGTVEEIWSPPLGGSMMFSFKLVADDIVQFYELGAISEENNTLILRLRHFHDNLGAWEEKDHPLEFRLVKITENKAYFEGFTFEKVNNNEINLYVLIHSEGKEAEARFNYHRFLP